MLQGKAHHHVGLSSKAPFNHPSCPTVDLTVGWSSSASSLMNASVLHGLCTQHGYVLHKKDDGCLA